MNSHLSRLYVATQLKPPVGAHRADVSLQSALLRIGFAGPHSLLCAGELLPRLSTLTAEAAPKRRSQWNNSPRRPLAVILPCEARTFLIHNHVRDCSAHSRPLFYSRVFPLSMYASGKIDMKTENKEIFPPVFRNKCFLFRNRAI